MLQEGDDTPSRYELLSMVRKHSSSLGNTIKSEDGLPVEMDSRFWRGIFDMYFIRGKESRRRQDDDLIFFVRETKMHNFETDDSNNDGCPYFVRRWGSQLENIAGENIEQVDWRRTFYLNLIAHTSFTVTVAICSHQVLQNHRPGQESSLSPIYKIVKTVYASPSRVNFHLDSKKEVETSAAYPDICFAIDDFDSTFDAVVLTDADHCYCVLLNATDGAAFPKQQGASEPNNASSNVTLFSGFVSYQLVREAYDAGRSRSGFFSFAQSPEKLDKLFMRGPGGCGEVEVAVSGVTDQSEVVGGTYSPVSSKKGFGIGFIVRKAASAASVAAKHVYAAATPNPFEDGVVPIRCCLMSVSLPWENIARDLLFKGRPVVNL